MRYHTNSRLVGSHYFGPSTLCKKTGYHLRIAGVRCMDWPGLPLSYTSRLFHRPDVSYKYFRTKNKQKGRKWIPLSEPPRWGDGSPRLAIQQNTIRHRINACHYPGDPPGRKPHFFHEFFPKNTIQHGRMTYSYPS